jgi:uncharacterized membrane protein
MTNALFRSPLRALAAGVLLVALLAALAGGVPLDHAWGAFVIRWLHVVAGVVWLGLLWYFNVVQIPSMAALPDELKPAVVRTIAPRALLWFRWAAAATVVSGLLLAAMLGYLGSALLLQRPHLAIGVGMWLALLMAFNVWFVLWPLQKRVLGVVPATPEERAAATRSSLVVSRVNLMLSLPMLYAMVAQQNGGM